MSGLFWRRLRARGEPIPPIPGCWRGVMPAIFRSPRGPDRRTRREGDRHHDRPCVHGPLDPGLPDQRWARSCSSATTPTRAPWPKRSAP